MDVSKDRLYCDDKNDLKRKQCQDVLVYTLKALLAVVAPIAPFTCEDIYQYYIIDNNKNEKSDNQKMEYVDKDTGKGTGVYDVNSVFQNLQWPSLSNTSSSDRKSNILNGWKIISATRDATKRQIENIRKEDIIELGDDLEAKLILNKLLFQMIQMIMTVWSLCAQDAKRLFAVDEKNGKGSLCGVVKKCAHIYIIYSYI